MRTVSSYCLSSGSPAFFTAVLLQIASVVSLCHLFTSYTCTNVTLEPCTCLTGTVTSRTAVGSQSGMMQFLQDSLEVSTGQINLVEHLIHEKRRVAGKVGSHSVQGRFTGSVAAEGQQLKSIFLHV